MNVCQLRWTAAVAVALCSLFSAPLAAQDGLPTLAEATELSKHTGRPILAMAGQKT